jgi:Tol biopolymer transport system component
MRRPFFLVVLLPALVMLAACGSPQVESQAPSDSRRSDPALGSVSTSSGRIVFMRGDPSSPGGGHTYTVDPNGGDERKLFLEGNSEFPTWSPDGTEIHVFCCGDGMVAHFVDPDTGEVVRALPQPDPSLELYCGGSWSPDGKRITCAGFGVDDPSLNGIYTVRASDGGGLRRVTSSPDGGYDTPGDFSPDGDRIVFLRLGEDGQAGIFVTNVDGSGPQQISPPNVMVADTSAGSWSPDGSQILFVAASEDQHKEIWIADADGISPHRFEMTPACGGSFSDASSAGCYSPKWSPDGSMIVFTRSSWDGKTENIYIVNADGTGLQQVTDGGADDNADWGNPPGEE